MKIYEINEKIQELQNKDIEPELLKDTLESLQLELNIKLDSIASWIESNKMQIEWCKKKKLDFANKQKALENQNERLNEFLTYQLKLQNTTNLKTYNHVLHLRNFKQRVCVPDVQQIPIDYVVVKETRTADKTKLYQDLKNGKQIMGASLEENKKVIID